MGCLHTHLFLQNQFFINGVAIHIKLTRAPDTFSVLGPTDDTEGIAQGALKIKLDQIALCVKCHTHRNMLSGNH